MTVSRRLLLEGGAGLAVALPAGEVASGGAPQVTRLDLNENPWGPSRSVLAAIQAALPGVNRYVHGEQRTLIDQIAALEGVRADQIVLGEVLAPLGLQLAAAGGSSSRFVHASPGYPGFTGAVAAVGGTLVGVPLDARLENDLPALLAAVDAETKALFLVNPHNPSGTVSDPAQFHAFLQEASERTLVIVDEAYLEFSDDFAGRSATPLVRAGANIIVFRTLAKIYGLAGLQAGYALLPPALSRDLRAKGLGAPHSLDRLTLAASAAALADQDHVRRVRIDTARERDLWHADLDALGWRRTRSQANFVFFRSPQGDAALTRALGEQGFSIGLPNPPLDAWSRISIGLPQENARVRAAVRHLAT